MIRINNTQYFYFLEQADALRRSGLLCDVIVKVQSRTFRAHRLVLACASKVLSQQLDQKGVDTPTYCTLESLSAHTFQQVLEFIYTHAVEVPVKDLLPLLRAAQLLEMQLLEDQCRTQLDVAEPRKDTEEVKGEKETAKESPIPDNEVQDTFFSSKGAGVSTSREKHSPSGLPNSHEDLRSPRKRERFPSLPGAFGSDRDSVITRSSSSSFTSPCSFPASMWNSETHLNTLRRIAENYSSLIAAHPLQCLNQSSVLYPFSLSPQHMLPELSSHFQSPLQNSALGLSAFRPSCATNIYTGNRRMGSIIKHSLLKRKKCSQNVLNGPAKSEEQSYSKMHKPNPDADEDCHHCHRARLLDDPHLGKSLAGCQFCGRRHAQQHEAETRGDSRGEKPYQCKHCPKKFSLKHQLDTHHRVHTGEKPFECRLCGQRSRDYSAMIKHLRTHGGASPYQCTVCLEFCSSLVAMQRHVKSHALQDFPSDWSINNTYLYISHI